MKYACYYGKGSPVRKFFDTKISRIMVCDVYLINHTARCIGRLNGVIIAWIIPYSGKVSRI